MISLVIDVFPAYLALWARSEPLALLESLKEIAAVVKNPDQRSGFF